MLKLLFARCYDVQEWVHYTNLYRLFDSLVAECWHRVREVPGSIPSQGPRHTKDVIKMVPVVPLFGTQHQKGNTASFSRIKIGKKSNG